MCVIYEELLPWVRNGVASLDKIRMCAMPVNVCQRRFASLTEYASVILRALYAAFDSLVNDRKCGNAPDVIGLLFPKFRNSAVVVNVWVNLLCLR